MKKLLSSATKDTLLSFSHCGLEFAGNGQSCGLLRPWWKKRVKGPQVLMTELEEKMNPINKFTEIIKSWVVHAY